MNKKNIIFLKQFDNKDEFHKFVKNFKGNKEFFMNVAKDLSKLIKEKNMQNTFDCLTYIPSFKEDKLNFSKELAKALSTLLDKDLVQTLKKVKDTQELKFLSHKQRKYEIENAFELIPNAKDKKICIVDDFFVSGATINEAIKVIGDCLVVVSAKLTI